MIVDARVVKLSTINIILLTHSLLLTRSGLDHSRHQDIKTRYVNDDRFQILKLKAVGMIVAMLRRNE